MHRTALVLVGALSAATLAPEALAQLSSNFVAPGFRGDTNTEYSQWENFTSAYTPGPAGNAPDVETSGGGQLFQLEQPTAPPMGVPLPPITISSANNIYTGWQVGDFALTDDAPGDIQTVSLQVAASGMRFDWDGFTLDYGGGIVAPDMISALFDEQVVIPTPGGNVTSYNQVYRLTWDLSPFGDDVTGYTVDFATVESSISLDAIALDVAFVPTPGVLAAFGLAGLGLTRRRR